MSNPNKFSVCTGEIRITGEQLQHLQRSGYTIAAVFTMPGEPRLMLEFEGSEDEVDGAMAEIVWFIFPRGDALRKVLT